MVTKILIFKEKHCDRYFNASTPEEKARAFYRVLKERYTDGYWYYRNYEADFALSVEDTAILSFTDEQIKALPETIAAEWKTKQARLLKRMKTYRKEKQEEDEWFNALTFLLEHSEDDAVSLTVKDAPGEWGGKGNLAETLMFIRSDYEYERYEIATVE